MAHATSWAQCRSILQRLPLKALTVLSLAFAVALSVAPFALAQEGVAHSDGVDDAHLAGLIGQLTADDQALLGVLLGAGPAGMMGGLPGLQGPGVGPAAGDGGLAGAVGPAGTPAGATLGQVSRFLLEKAAGFNTVRPSIPVDVFGPRGLRSGDRGAYMREMMTSYGVYAALYESLASYGRVGEMNHFDLSRAMSDVMSLGGNLFARDDKTGKYSVDPTMARDAPRLFMEAFGLRNFSLSDLTNVANRITGLFDGYKAGSEAMRLTVGAEFALHTIRTAGGDAGKLGNEWFTAYTLMRKYEHDLGVHVALLETLTRQYEGALGSLAHYMDRRGLQTVFTKLSTAGVSVEALKAGDAGAIQALQAYWDKLPESEKYKARTAMGTNTEAYQVLQLLNLANQAQAAGEAARKADATVRNTQDNLYKAQANKDEAAKKAAEFGFDLAKIERDLRKAEDDTKADALRLEKLVADLEVQYDEASKKIGDLIKEVAALQVKADAGDLEAANALAAKKEELAKASELRQNLSRAMKQAEWEHGIAQAQVEALDSSTHRVAARLRGELMLAVSQNPDNPLDAVMAVLLDLAKKASYALQDEGFAAALIERMGMGGMGMAKGMQMEMNLLGMMGMGPGAMMPGVKFEFTSEALEALKAAGIALGGPNIEGILLEIARLAAMGENGKLQQNAAVKMEALKVAKAALGEADPKLRALVGAGSATIGEGLKSLIAAFAKQRAEIRDEYLRLRRELDSLDADSPEGEALRQRMKQLELKYGEVGEKASIHNQAAGLVERLVAGKQKRVATDTWGHPIQDVNADGTPKFEQVLNADGTPALDDEGKPVMRPVYRIVVSDPVDELVKLAREAAKEQGEGDERKQWGRTAKERYADVLELLRKVLGPSADDVIGTITKLVEARTLTDNEKEILELHKRALALDENQRKLLEKLANEITNPERALADEKARKEEERLAQAAGISLEEARKILRNPELTAAEREEIMGLVAKEEERLATDEQKKLERAQAKALKQAEAEARIEKLEKEYAEKREALAKRVDELKFKVRTKEEEEEFQRLTKELSDLDQRYMSDLSRERADGMKAAFGDDEEREDQAGMGGFGKDMMGGGGLREKIRQLSLKHDTAGSTDRYLDAGLMPWMQTMMRRMRDQKDYGDSSGGFDDPFFGLGDSMSELAMISALDGDAYSGLDRDMGPGVGRRSKLPIGFDGWRGNPYHGMLGHGVDESTLADELGAWEGPDEMDEPAADGLGASGRTPGRTSRSQGPRGASASRGGAPFGGGAPQMGAGGGDFGGFDSFLGDDSAPGDPAPGTSPSGAGPSRASRGSGGPSFRSSGGGLGHGQGGFGLSVDSGFATQAGSLAQPTVQTRNDSRSTMGMVRNGSLFGNPASAGTGGGGRLANASGGGLLGGAGAGSGGGGAGLRGMGGGPSSMSPGGGTAGGLGGMHGGGMDHFYRSLMGTRGAGVLGSPFLGGNRLTPDSLLGNPLGLRSAGTLGALGGGLQGHGLGLDGGLGGKGLGTPGALGTGLGGVAPGVAGGLSPAGGVGGLTGGTGMLAGGTAGAGITAGGGGGGLSSGSAALSGDAGYDYPGSETMGWGGSGSGDSSTSGDGSGPSLFATPTDDRTI